VSVRVKGKSFSIPLFRLEKNGKIGVINLGEAIEQLIKLKLKPTKIYAVHITEIPDPSMNIGGVHGKKAVVTIIYE